MPQVDPLRLTSDAAYMAEFRKSQAWDVFNHYLELMGEDQENMLINGVTLSIEQVRFHQGFLKALRAVQLIPENVLVWAKQAAGEASEGKMDKLTLA